jgi:hypothetical protein
MNKINKVYTILANRLPKRLVIPIVIYSTTEELIKIQSEESNRDFNEVVKYYNKLYKVENYLNTSYCRWVVIKHDINAFNINMLASFPIKVSQENVECREEYEIAFLFLHEFGHFTMKKIHKSFDEILADKFAIRWIKILIKEGLINYDK